MQKDDILFILTCIHKCVPDIRNTIIWIIIMIARKYQHRTFEAGQFFNYIFNMFFRNTVSFVKEVPGHNKQITLFGICCVNHVSILDIISRYLS